MNLGALEDQNGANHNGGVKAHNGGVKAQNGAVEGRPVVADSHHFDIEQNPDLRKVGSGWIRIRIKLKRVLRFPTKVIRIRNPVLAGGRFRIQKKTSWGKLDFLTLL